MSWRSCARTIARCARAARSWPRIRASSERSLSRLAWMPASRCSRSSSRPWKPLIRIVSERIEPSSVRSRSRALEMPPWRPCGVGAADAPAAARTARTATASNAWIERRTMRRRNDASGLPRRLQLLCPMLAVPPPAALPAPGVRVEPGRDDELAIGLLGYGRDGNHRRGRTLLVALAPRLIAALAPGLIAPPRSLFLARPRLLAGPRPPDRVLAPEHHASSGADPEAQPDDGRDRRPGQLVPPQEHTEHDADDDADRPAHRHRAPHRLALALGGLTPAAPAGPLEHLLAALGGTGHERHPLASPVTGQPRRTRS